MRLTWNEIRLRAARFSREWRGEWGQQGQTQLYYRRFFKVFGLTARQVARFQEPVRLLGEKRGFIDLFWKGVLLVEQKSAGRSLPKAKTQALEYFPGLKNAELPRYLLRSDFRSFELYDLDGGDEIEFQLEDFPQFVERFGFIVGVQKRTFRDQDPVNIEASELARRIYDSLAPARHRGPDLDRLLVRLVFCLFADDTGIFQPRDIFLDYLKARTAADGSDVGSKFIELCQVLNTPEDARPTTLDRDLARFPYVDGDLFRQSIQIPAFDSDTRELLLDACRFDWSTISPAIFGSLLQSVMDGNQRRARGAHYTTEKNILKVIEPLFLDDLRADFAKVLKRKGRGRRAALRAFHERLGQFTFFDPACGCGNFLIIAYREVRSLEIEVIRALRACTTAEDQRELHAAGLSRIDVNRFHGIEIGAFPARIAETALWMMDRFMNNRLSLEFGETCSRIPPTTSSRIVQGDTLETDWADVLPPERCSYVLGNPPFAGAKLQTAAQRAQVRRVAALGGTGGTLDYVAAWFFKACDYARAGGAKVGFVATNSITQGEQAGQLWPALFKRHGAEISFAHRTFAWGSDARGKAHVHVVILGLDLVPSKRKKRLFSYGQVDREPEETLHRALSPYLFGAGRLRNPRVVVREAAKPLNGLPRLRIGSKPIDGGHYIFTAEQRDALLKQEPGAVEFFRPYVGSQEFLSNKNRWILALHSASFSELMRLPRVRARIEAVRAYRLASCSAPTNALAETPTQYHVDVLPSSPFLALPETSSEQREYVPIAWMQPPVVPSNSIRITTRATKPLMALLSSAMHMSWLRHIGGRLKSDYRYSIGLVYNTFPLPVGGIESLSKLAPLADAVLAARAVHSDEALGDLYDPALMPVNLRRAHQRLDGAVDGLYRRKSFCSDRERAEFLLALYEEHVLPLDAKK